LTHLAGQWGIPLLAPGGIPEARPSPSDILAAALGGRDARLAMGVALWLSLVEPGMDLGGPWSEEDRRRIGYLCDIARCLRMLRGDSRRGRPARWPERVAGLAPRRWSSSVPLFASVAPELPRSLFGRKWGVAEVIPFSDYAAFQRQYIERREAVRRAA
jgi:hypothetical protein